MEMPKELGDVSSILRRADKAEKLWEMWRSLWLECYDYAAPQRETFNLHAPGQKKNRQIFDSTAVIGTEQFVNRFQSATMPPWRKWASLVAGSSTPKEDIEAANNALEDVTETLFNSLNHSNFTTEINPALVDYAISTGALLIEEGDFTKDEDFRFTNVPLAELRVERPAYGRVKTKFWKKKIEVGYIKQTWPTAELDAGTEQLAKDKPLEEIEILICMVYEPEKELYHHLVIYPKKKILFFQQAFEQDRLIVFRPQVVPGEAYGRGPIMQVLSDIRTVNKVKEFTLQNAALQVAGVYTGVDDGVFNPYTVRIAPGTIIPVSSNDTRSPSLAPLNRSGDIGLANIVIEDLQNNIKKALFIDPIGEINDPVRTATEIQIRAQENLKDRGATVGRFKSEFIEPLIAACIDILVSRGKIAPIRVDGKDVTIKQNSPMAQAEDMEDFQNSRVWWEMVMQLGNLVGPEAIIGTVKVEDLSSYWAKKLSVPADLSRTKAEKAAFGKVAVDMAQQQAAEGGQGIG